MFIYGYTSNAGSLKRLFEAFVKHKSKTTREPPHINEWLDDFEHGS